MSLRTERADAADADDERGTFMKYDRTLEVVMCKEERMVEEKERISGDGMGLWVEENIGSWMVVNEGEVELRRKSWSI